MHVTLTNLLSIVSIYINVTLQFQSGRAITSAAGHWNSIWQFHVLSCDNDQMQHWVFGGDHFQSRHNLFGLGFPIVVIHQLLLLFVWDELGFSLALSFYHFLWITLISFACIELTIQTVDDKVCRSVNVHSNDMPHPAKLDLQQHRFYADVVHLFAFQDFQICDIALSVNSYDGAKETHVELFVLLDLSVIKCPGFTSI